MFSKITIKNYLFYSLKADEALYKIYLAINEITFVYFNYCIKFLMYQNE